MIWLTWRQFRPAAAMTAAVLAALAAFLLLSGPGLADDYSAGIAACTAQGSGCSDFLQDFFGDHRSSFLAVTAVVLVLPALIGLFWGAPLIARELEAGTDRLVWNQSVTRGRWLAVKLGLVGLAAIAAAGLCSLAVDWWSDPLDVAADYPRMAPLLFGARGIAPIGYAAFGFAFGVTVGMLVRRTLPAMAITLVVFVAFQIAMPVLVRPHLVSPVRSTQPITASNLTMFVIGGPQGPISVSGEDAYPDSGAWVLTNQTVDASGRVVDEIPSQLVRRFGLLTPGTGPCASPAPGQAHDSPRGGAEEDLSPCLAAIERLGYRQQVSYQPSSRFWRLQWYETGIYAALSFGLLAFCFWWLRRRLS